MPLFDYVEPVEEIGPLTLAPETLPEILEHRMRMLRIIYGLNQVKFAAKMGSHRTHIHRIENRQGLPSAAVLERMARAFNVSVRYLLTGQTNFIQEIP